MMAATDDRTLAARAHWVRAGCYGSLAIALVGTLLFVSLIEPGSGVQDVHFPSAGRAMLTEHRAMLRPGEPWIVGRGVGRLPQALALVLHTGSLVAALVAFWALWRRNKGVGWCAIGYVAMMQAVGPIPTTMQPEPPVAVSAATAARLMAGEPEDAVSWHRYVRAQIAFVKGDRDAAAALAARLEPDDLYSPIEAPYRLQYLRGGPITTTSACFEFGCVSPDGQAAGRTVALALLASGLAGAVGAALLWRMFNRRSRRIGTLRAHGLNLGIET